VTGHCWLRLKKHSWERTGSYGRIADWGSHRVFTVEWVRCTACGHETTRNVRQGGEEG